jgi:predicted NUDIX family NTP pyrophosphohydrolase
LLVHPGGPLWKKRDEGAWSIPKGEIESGERPIDVARREFQEELGVAAPDGAFTTLGTVRQAGGKVVHAWAVEADVNVDLARSATFEMEWPPRSGRKQAFPEVDRAEWFDIEAAHRKLVPAQAAFLERLQALG